MPTVGRVAHQRHCMTGGGGPRREARQHLLVSTPPRGAWGSVVRADPVDAIDVDWRGAAQPGSVAGTLPATSVCRERAALTAPKCRKPALGLAEAPGPGSERPGAGDAREPAV